MGTKIREPRRSELIAEIREAYERGLSIADTAQLLGIGESWVRDRLHEMDLVIKSKKSPRLNH